MKIEYDREVDAAYIYVVDAIVDGEVKKSVEVEESIVFDYDAHGKLLGIEILHASKVMHKKLLHSS